MKSLRVLAVVGLAVALVAVPALAVRVTIKISGTPTAGDLFVQVDDRDAVKVTLKDKQPIKEIRDAIVKALNDQQAGTAEAIGDNRVRISNVQAIKIGEAADKLSSLVLEVNQSVKARELTFKVASVVPEPKDIKEIRDAIVKALNDQQAGTAEKVGDDQILINVEKAIKIGEAADKLSSLVLEVNQSVTARGLTFKVVALPTLTEWGLIALAALLMGGMGYMLYRRRPALRPAAP